MSISSKTCAESFYSDLLGLISVTFRGLVFEFREIYCLVFSHSESSNQILNLKFISISRSNSTAVLSETILELFSFRLINASHAQTTFVRFARSYFIRPLCILQLHSSALHALVTFVRFAHLNYIRPLCMLRLNLLARFFHYQFISSSRSISSALLVQFQFISPFLSPPIHQLFSFNFNLSDFVVQFHSICCSRSISFYQFFSFKFISFAITLTDDYPNNLFSTLEDY